MIGNIITYPVLMIWSLKFTEHCLPVDDYTVFVKQQSMAGLGNVFLILLKYKNNLYVTEYCYCINSHTAR